MRERLMLGSLRPAPRRKRSGAGQTTVEYVLMIGACSVPLAYGIWYVFFHPGATGQDARIVEFMRLVIDFASW